MNDLIGNITRLQSISFPSKDAVRTNEVRQLFAASGSTLSVTDSNGKLPEPVSDGVSTQVSQAVRKLNEVSQNLRRDLSFNVDKESGRVVIQVYDSETRELIRTIPPEETRAMIPDIDDMVNGIMKGLFVKTTA